MTELTAFSMPHQEETYWCWAAVSMGVSHFYDSASAFTQCSIAAQVLGIPSCCTSHAPCNQTSFLERALQRTGNFVSMSAAAAPFPAVQSEVNASRPLCVRTQWSDGSGHFIAVTGYDDAPGAALDAMVSVQDPFYGVSRVPYQVFLTSYRGEGRWTHSYLTCS